MENAAGPRQLEPGTKLDDKYRIEQLIAVGGMGAVYLGTHTGLRKRVAIKVLNPQTSTPAMVERFHREAITASQIGHEGIAQVTDFGTSREGEPFLVMEYLEGESLAARLTTSGRLPIEVACELGCAILAPLAAAHEAGIVHRDLKPDNVFLVRQSRGEIVKLLDFGISRGPGLEGEFRLTKTGVVLGTPYYMSPEQARGDSDIGPAADLYAFGVILYEMLLGHVPIEGENYNQLMYRVLTAEYAPPRKERPEIHPELERIILQAMALEPAKRPASAAELEQRLLAFCRSTFRDHQIERIASSSRISLPAVSSSSIPIAATVSATESGPQASVATARTAASVIEPLRGGLRTPAPEPTTPDAALAEPVAESLAPRRRALWIGGAAVVLVGALAGTLMIAKGGGAATRGAPLTEAVPPPKAVPPTAPTPIHAPPTAADHSSPRESAAPVEITLRFEVEPAAAKVELDGAPVTTRQLTVRKDDATHRLRITAPGFTTREDEVHFDESQKLVIQLKRASTRTGRPPQQQQQQQQHKPDRIESTSPYGS